MSEWNWKPIQAKNGTRYEVLLVLPADTLSEPNVLREFGRIDLGHNWFYDGLTGPQMEVADQKVVAFREASVDPEDAAKALAVEVSP